MANNQIKQFLEFANIQIAAEAFLLRDLDNGVLPGGAALQARLVEGNTHASKFTPVQAAQFVTDFQVLAQYRNDPTLPGQSGFSGTLFKNRSTGQLTLSFRSTEFIDDAVRDSKSTNELEVRDLGWAFGQIAEMEDWYAQLRQDPTLLGGKSFNVTGYSLGGHLATAFNLLRREEAAVTGEPSPVINSYTFNGAGVGGLKNNRRLTDVMADFRKYRDDPNVTASGAWAALPLETRNKIIADAESRAGRIEAERVRLLILGAPFAFNSRPPAGAQNSVQYQIAALLAARDTSGVSIIAITPVFAPDAQRLFNMTEIVGSDSGNLGPSFVANSGVHYGYRQEVYIEDQPLVRGSFPQDFAVQFAQGTLNLLVPDPDNNNVADTHSLVLLVDSLSLMAAMEALDPDITFETARQIFAAASNAKKSTVFGQQGNAEGDTLERTLDALRALVIGPKQTPTGDYRAALAGNTWHLDALRGPFQANLAELNTRIGDLRAASGAQYSIQSIAGLPAAGLAGLASLDDDTGRAYRYTLKNRGESPNQSIACIH